MAEDPSTGDIVESLPVCQWCLLLSPGPPRPFCPAFPLADGGIPDEIWIGSDPHLDPLEGQVSDYIFTPKEHVDVIKFVAEGLLPASTLVRHGKRDPRKHLDR